MRANLESHSLLAPWIAVARTVWTPALKEQAARAHDYLVPTTSQEYALIERFFDDPATLSTADAASVSWSNVGEAFGELVFAEVTVDRPAVPADLYYCCGVVVMHLIARTGPPYLVDQEHCIHAIVGAAYNVVLRGDDTGRAVLRSALLGWPDAFGCEFTAIGRGPDRANRMPAMLAALIDIPDRLDHEGLTRRAAKFSWMLGAVFAMPQQRAQAMIAELARRRRSCLEHGGRSR